MEERLDQNYIKQYFLHKKQAHGWDCSNGAECAYLGPGFDVSVVGWWLGGEPDQPAAEPNDEAGDLVHLLDEQPHLPNRQTAGHLAKSGGTLYSTGDDVIYTYILITQCAVGWGD